MPKNKVKQITFNEALDLMSKGETVYVINTSAKEPKLSKLSTIAVGKLVPDNNNYVFLKFEEA